MREVRVAKDEDERQALWRGRKGAFGSISRLAPNYIVADGTVPRTKLPEALRRVNELGCRYDIRIASVFHAGDGNLHPLLLFDSRDPADREKVMAAGMDVLRICAELGGTVSGEHGIGVEKLEALPLVFTDDDLRAQGFVKDAFDPRGVANPGKALLRMDPAPRAPAPRTPHALRCRPVSDPTIIRGLNPREELYPADETQLAEALTRAGAEGLACYVGGGLTKQDWGAAPGRIDMLISTTGLRGCSDVDPDNLTLSAAPGTTVAEARAAATAVGRVLPLDPSLPGQGHHRRSDGHRGPRRPRRRIRGSAGPRAGRSGHPGRRYGGQVRWPDHEERHRLRHDQAAGGFVRALWACSPR